ncbi:MAG: hypothetical protein RMI91_03050 [Gemmatales bacterium]|nr:hypothetical protein [Gemmatales bacterium]MDW7993607.1 hypothetical protein [Gemmatales bacterium]
MQIAKGSVGLTGRSDNNDIAEVGSATVIYQLLGRYESTLIDAVDG